MTFLPQPIKTIIRSFENYGLADIKHNKSRSIAAFILCMCFIDQLSSFRYKLKRDRNKRPEDFIDEYMPQYRGLDLYDMFRHSLIHHYSSEGKFDIDHRGNENVPYADKNGRIFINSNVFVKYVEKAFEAVKADFMVIGSEAYENAQIRSTRQPVLVDTWKG